MNAKLKSFLMIVAKNAVNAAIVTGGPLVWNSGQFNFHTWPDFLNVARLVGMAVIAREGIVWVPVILKWANTGDKPSN